MKKKLLLLFIHFMIMLSLFSEGPLNNDISSLKKVSISDSKYSFYIKEEKNHYSIIKKYNNISIETTTGNHSSFSIQKQLIDDADVFNYLDHDEPLFLKKTVFFSNYLNSNLQKQLEKSRLRNTSAFIFDINNDNEDEVIYFGYPYTGSNPSGLSIYKYINNEWKEIFNECYFGWDDFYSDKNYLAEEWFTPKPFPYDFVEYKGKIGLRIICYDRPKDWPTHYHAQFWAYDEKMQKYEMLEEIWEAEEDTPPDGLIFAGAKEGLFK